MRNRIWELSVAGESLISINTSPSMRYLGFHPITQTCKQIQDEIRSERLLMFYATNTFKTVIRDAYHERMDVPEEEQDPRWEAGDPGFTLWQEDMSRELDHFKSWAGSLRLQQRNAIGKVVVKIEFDLEFRQLLDYKGRSYEPMDDFWRELGGNLMQSGLRKSQLEVVVHLVAESGSCDAMRTYSDEDCERVEELLSELFDIDFTVRR